VRQRSALLFTWLGQSGGQLAVAPHLEKPEGSLKHHNLDSAISAAAVDPHLRFSPSPFPVSGQSCCAVVVGNSLHRNPFDTQFRFVIPQLVASDQLYCDCAAADLVLWFVVCCGLQVSFFVATLCACSSDAAAIATRN
jgi:hypothetical protein